jgi:tRNA(Arg) A34 adenosine deaminase TadA
MGYSPTATELEHLRRCIELAAEALDDGDEPFGSVLADGGGSALAEDRNRVSGGDHTRHPEIELARWAAHHLTPQQRAVATVFTSGEHCPMCAAAHGWVGLGRIVYVHSGAQLAGWRQRHGFATSPVAYVPASTIAPGVTVDGPVDDMVPLMEELHERWCERHR